MKINWKGIFLWSNQFYGVCAVLLAVESNLLLLRKLPSIYLLLFIHLVTVLYYTHAYLQENHDGIYNERSRWYQGNKKYIKLRQLFYTCVCIWLVFIKLKISNHYLQASIYIQVVLNISLVIAAIYYVPNLKFLPLNSYRQKGILKSISIAWIWTIFCCIFPVWFALGNTFVDQVFKFDFWNHFIFLFFFILILSILFDFKDLYRDKKELVNTIVAKHGVSFTIYRIIVPLLIMISLFEIISYVTHYNTKWNLIANIIILALTFYISRKVKFITSIHNNLLLIDGLIIIKAILSIAFFYALEIC